MWKLNKITGDIFPNLPKTGDYAWPQVTGSLNIINSIKCINFVGGCS